ncbi:MAG: helix-turn-helix domain-containing protein [Christensenellales bacterium]
MEIGAKIKDLRLKGGLTQEELGDRCELTKGYISQLENELTSPSIATLLDILSALGTTPSEFFSDDGGEQVVFGENDYCEKLTDEQKIVWLVPNAQKNEMEPIFTEIAPHKVTQSDMPHEGEEFGYVLEGEIYLNIGKREYFVKQGESFYFESKKVHYIENKSDSPAKIIWVSSPPTF